MTAVLHTQNPTFSSSILNPESEEEEEEEEESQGSVLAVLAAVLRKSIVGCSAEREEGDLMEIGWPTNVRHVAHVTFDRFHGFLGLPVEFEPDVPRRAPSASASVFGVSAESMQCSYDSRGNSVPTILLLMQRCLYSQGGLQAEGIFRINAENSQEEHVRGELNRGVVPNGIDVHCLAGLIKAWFRELPRGVLDSLTSEQVMQCQTEEEYDALVKLLPPTEAALLDWAINLMADVAQEEHYNKMNARNIAMVFAPNMTQMDDPLTALMYAVQVMNFLKTLIERTLKEREEAVIESASASHSDPSDENEHHSPSRLSLEAHTEEETERIFVSKEPILESHLLPTDNLVEKNDGIKGPRLVCASNFEGTACSTNGQQPCQVPTSNSLVKRTESTANGFLVVQSPAKCRRKKGSQSSNVKHKKLVKKANSHQAIRTATPTEKRGISITSRINSTAERVEAWR